MKRGNNSKQGIENSGSHETFVSFKIAQSDESASDTSIMTIVRATIKAILKTERDINIIAPTIQNQPPMITRKNGCIPAAEETKLIRQYIHKGIMTKEAFHGILSIEKEPILLDLLTHAKLKKLHYMHKVLQLPFGVSQVFMAGVLYGTMAQENRNMLADHITSKMANHLQGKLIQVQAS